MRRRFRVAARQCKAECRAHRQENRVADQLWLEVDGLTAQVLTGIYSAETHLPQPLRISVRARLAMADHYEPTTPLSGSKDYMHLKFAATERSEERQVGKGGGSTWRSRWWTET